MKELDLAGFSDEEFLKAVSEEMLPLKKNPNGTLQKESFIKVFKYCGDYAKLKTKDAKKGG